MALKILLLLYFIINIFSIGNGFQKQSLSGKWNVQNTNKSVNIPATVPGGIYSDLMEGKILDDIYYRFNDIDYRWVANETWIYTTKFYASEDHFTKDNIDLVFDGLDTFSSIVLNDVIVGKSDNMFIRYKFNIKPYLKHGENNLIVIFKSPIITSNKLHEIYAKNYIIPPMCVPKEYQGECHVNLIRKMQASFSWDWGPAFPSVGIWKPVYIRSYNSVAIQDVTVNIVENDNIDWDINLEVYFESRTINYNLSGVLITTLTTDIEEITVYNDVKGKTDVNGEYIEKISLTIPKAYVQLWWPNGFGKQPLYNLSISFVPTTFEEVTVKTIKIGFRKIELLQNPLEKGLTFYFKVNDIAIFSKGSNWIPANILPEKGSNKKELKYLLQSAKDVHMNMLRVWGGGVYESDEFYELADEYGILIWQDFMFACAMYPVNREFLENVKLEVQQQVRRLQHHSSVALWAGNNENEAALRGNWYGTSGNFSLYKRDYVILYVDTIREACLKNDKSRSFMVSSPSNGLESETEGYVANNPYDTHYGDIHYYNYIMDGWDQNIYSRTRFSSEYGFQSIPNYETLISSTNVTSDLVQNSEFLESRQHHPAGYNEMKILIIKHLKLPDNNKENYLKTLIYYTQISQAMAYKAQTEYYRQWRSNIDEDGKGNTMGALYWQLNDVWPAPSWSSIDFRQRWKMVHYYAKKFFAPLLISANISPSKQMTIFALSDLTGITYNATLSLSVYKWDNMHPIHSENKTLNILPGYSAIITQFWLDKYLENVGCGTLKSAKNNCFVYFSLKDYKGELLGPDNFVFPVPLKSSVGLSTPNLSVKIVKARYSNMKQTNFNILISTDRITPFVWLDTGVIKGKFSDNGFLQVTKYKSVQFESNEPITLAQLQSTLTITSLLSPEHL